MEPLFVEEKKDTPAHVLTSECIPYTTLNCLANFTKVNIRDLNRWVRLFEFRLNPRYAGDIGIVDVIKNNRNAFLIKSVGKRTKVCRADVVDYILNVILKNDKVINDIRRSKERAELYIKNSGLVPEEITKDSTDEKVETKSLIKIEKGIPVFRHSVALKTITELNKTFFKMLATEPEYKTIKRIIYLIDYFNNKGEMGGFKEKKLNEIKHKLDNGLRLNIHDTGNMFRVYQGYRIDEKEQEELADNKEIYYAN